MASTQPDSDSLRPWQFFTLGGLVCATVAVFLIRGTTPANLIFVCLGIFGAALVGLAALSALRPLTTGETRQPEMVGGQTRAAVEREKNLLLRSIKELEFDHAMGKVADNDFHDMSARLRSRAVRLLQELDSTSSGYRDLIERELAKRLVKAGTTAGTPVVAQDSSPAVGASVAQDFSPALDEPATPAAAGVCPSCATVNDDDARFCKSCGTKLLAVLVAFLLSTFYFSLSPASAQFQMPDPKQMSGIPRPVTDLPTGHVSVRVIRGQLSNNIQGQPVEMQASGKVVGTVKTDENGRAEFSGIAPGTTTRAITVVDGERLESQEFPWPADGGIRLMLVATDKTASAAPALPPQPGNVVLGDQTRIIVEHTDGALQIYYLLDIQNTARAPVQPASAVVMDVPPGALSTTVLAGAPQAVARGDRVTISGPFKPGPTPVELAYRFPFSLGDVTVDQKIPLPVPNLVVLTKKIGDMSLSSPQLPNVQEREFEGEHWILAQGPALSAGATLSLRFSGLPHHSPVPRRIALGLAILIIGAAAWAASRKPTKGPNAARVKQLTGKREKIYGELVRLEQQRRTGGIDAAKFAERRPALIAQLERVYRDLDAEGGQGGHPTTQKARVGDPGAAA